MGIVIIFILVAVVVHGNFRRKELERRIETLEKIHGIERFDHESFEPGTKDGQ